MTNFFYYACPGREDATHIEVLFDDAKACGAAPVPLRADFDHGPGTRLEREEAIEVLEQLSVPSPENQLADVERHIEHMARLAVQRRAARR